MQIRTVSTNPMLGTTGWKQKIMVLRKEKDDENKAFKIYEKYQYAKSVEVQKL